MLSEDWAILHQRLHLFGNRDKVAIGSILTVRARAKKRVKKSREDVHRAVTLYQFPGTPCGTCPASTRMLIY